MGHRHHCPARRCTSQSPDHNHNYDDHEHAKDDDDVHLLRDVSNDKVGPSEADTSIFLDIPEKVN